MQKFCSAKLCYYNTPRNIQDVNISKIMQIFCPICMQITYCSKKCRDQDWLPVHKNQCASYKELAHKEQKQQNQSNLRCSSVNDTLDSVSTLKSIRRRPEEFQIVQNGRQADLGKGSYGQVKLVKDKVNDVEYAMKIVQNYDQPFLFKMQKKQIFEYCSVENLKREIKIQRKLVYPHIVKLHHYFEDKENVYLILEYAENGSLFSYLRKRRKLPEQEAFVYFFQTCLGIDYLHKNHIIHRDLKPENLLLDKDGNIKICDFGWSAETVNQQSKRTTFCGTCEYMAPEMLQNLPHDNSLDIWCLGILLYELFHGHAPFRGANEHEICQSIISFKPFTFEQNLSIQAKDLVKKILKFKAQERFTMKQIFEHPWMIQNAKHYKIEIPKFIFEISKPFKETPISQNNKNTGQKMQEVQIETDAQFVMDKYAKQPINGVQQKLNNNQQQQREPPRPIQNFEQRPSVSRLISKSLINIKGNEIMIQKEQRQQIQNTQRAQEQDVGFIDRVFLAFGCLKRDKLPGQN